MFRGSFPAIALVVFGIGIGIGFAFSRGWLPLSLEPVSSGRLGLEITQREPLPPPPDEGGALARQSRKKSIPLPEVDPEIFEKQSEPGENDAAVARAVDNSLVVTADASNSTEGSFTVPVNDERSASNLDDRPIIKPSNSSSQNRVRTRERNPVRLDPQAGIDDASSTATQEDVTAAKHQDPSESGSSRDSADAGATPAQRLAAAEEKLASGETLQAHRDLSKLYWSHKEFRPQIQELIDSTATAIFFQQRPHYVEPYVIQEGDRLQTIAKKYQLSWEYVAKLNRTDPKRIQVGQKLKVMKGPFAAVVDLNDFALTVHLQGYYVKRYKVGIGKENSSPLGKFTVLEKLENPQYTDSRTGEVTEGGDPSNPLGKRWIALGDSYGIHGTIDPGSIGKAESRGCIRLRDEDISEVYNFLVKGSEVVIRK